MMPHPSLQPKPQQQPYYAGQFFRSWIAAQRRRWERPTPARIAAGLTLLTWRERNRLRFQRWLHERGRLHEFPQ